MDGKKQKIDNSGKFPFVFVKTSPYQGNGLSRVLNMMSFFWNLFPVAKTSASQYGNPDIILASSVHPLTLVAGIKIARKYKIPCICEIRDLWPESIFEYGHMKKTSLVGKLLRSGEKWIYKKADKIIFTMAGGYDYIEERGWQGAVPKEKCFIINNGVDLEEFDRNKELYAIEDNDLCNKDIFKAVYAGSIRSVNNLKIVVDVAKELIGNDKIQILIWGSGDDLDELTEYANHLNLKNIIFKGHISKTYIPYVLSNADINISHARHTNILRFGMSQNKDFEYLASGKPVLRTMDSKHDIVAGTNSGISVKNQTVVNIKSAILDLYAIATEQREEYDKKCKNARKTAEEYDFKVLTAKLIGIIEKE